MADKALPSLVEVHWVDSSTVHGWVDHEVAAGRPVYRAVTVGYLIADDDEKLVIVSTVAQDGDVCATMVIPQVQVITKHRLAGTRRPWKGRRTAV